jgi:sarcosine oxidase
MSGAADVGVIGAGVVGLSTAAELVRRGRTVLCFERARPGVGQSAGRTRIFRHRHDDPGMVHLALRARAAWRDLEQGAGETLVGSEGVVIAGVREDEAARLERLGVRMRLLDRDALRGRIPLGGPGRSARAPDCAILDLDGGAIRAHRAVAVLAAAVGGQRLAAEVFGLTARSHSVTVHTAEGSHDCGHVVVAAGTETARFASELGISLRERRALHVRASFPAHPGTALPCLIDRSGLYGERVYASPADDGRLLAIGLSGREASLPVDEHDRLLPGADPSTLRARIEAYASAALPGVVGARRSTRLCMTTPLDAGDDALAAWQQGPVTLLAGNNLFKFAPLLGRLLADAAEERGLDPALRPHPR